MKHILTYTLMVSALSSIVCLAETPRPELRFDDAPLEVVLNAYADISGKKVEVVKGVDTKISLVLTNSVSVEEFIKFVEAKLKENNIGLFPISETRLVATWINPSKLPLQKHNTYSEILKQRGEEVKKRSASLPPSVPEMTQEELIKRLQQKQMKAIRQGAQPLPIPLTKETDDALVREGTLPSLEENKKKESVQPSPAGDR